ncbi:MAG: hypothetical protein J0I20_22550 [Chloroflexi bacterium]|nr:hypothetical protein [Chloroflexota bacterium]OJV99157.1 MAG: hypothetical protein BGO39_17020 [Chloroflexi bacterium 54-19]
MPQQPFNSANSDFNSNPTANATTSGKKNGVPGPGYNGSTTGGNAGANTGFNNLRMIPGAGLGGNPAGSGQVVDTALPPHNVEAEEAVLGSLLIDRDTIAGIAPVLQPQHFFSQERATIYQTLLQLYADQTPADLVTVRNELKAMGVLGDGEDQVRPSYLLKLLRETASPVHATHYAQIVLKHWLARQLIGECAQTVQLSYREEGMLEPGQLLAEHALRLQKLSNHLTGLAATHYLSHEKSLAYPDQLKVTGGDSLDDRWNQKEKRPGLRFGWSAFDGRDWADPPVLSLLPSTLTTILARTGGGKTIAAMQIADTNAAAGLNVLYFHVELNQDQMLARRYSRLTGVPVLTQLLKRVNEREHALLVQAAQEVAGWPGRVDFVHCPSWPVEKLVQELKARHYALIASQGHGYDLIVLDYLQRLGRSESSGRASEHESLAFNVRAVSDAANELNIAALMTSQVSRSESRQYEPPEVDEGLGSGDIERCSNQLVALAISEDKAFVKFAVRKNTFGTQGRTGELLYDARRLQFI